MKTLKRKLSQILTYDDLAEVFGLPSLESIEDQTWEYAADAGADAADEAIQAGESDRDADAAREEAESNASSEVFFTWKNGVYAVAEHEFDEAGLNLQGSGGWALKVVPITSWRDSATQIMEIVNGVGYFHFDNLKDFLDSGPYTPKEAVLSHLHWLKDRAEVYGDVRPAARYDSAVR